MFEKGKLILRRPEGIEEYRIESALYNIGSTFVCVDNIRTEDYVATFEVMTDEAIKVLEDNIDSGIMPFLEINHYYGFTEPRPSLKPGDKLYIPSGFNKRISDWATNIFQFSHEGIDEVHIEIISCINDQLEVKITGETDDISDSRDDRHKAAIYLHACFDLNPETAPSF